MKFKRSNYFQSTDTSLVEHLQQGDVIIHIRSFSNSDGTISSKYVTYIVQHKPVFFSRGKNWSVRITTKGGSQQLKNYSENIFINHLVMHRYYFPKTILNRIDKTADQLQSLIDYLNEPEFQIE